MDQGAPMGLKHKSAWPVAREIVRHRGLHRVSRLAAAPSATGAAGIIFGFGNDSVKTRREGAETSIRKGLQPAFE
jgi:hypothetical protein